MCDAKIRPIRPVDNGTELKCDRNETEHRQVPHRAVLKDYAYPGSETVVHWWEDDRRNFRGIFVECGGGEGICILPKGHRGDHAQ